MTQEEFAKIVWTQWAKVPDGERHPEELRPMFQVKLKGRRDSESKDSPYAFGSWAVSYADDDDPWMSDPILPNKRVMEEVIGIWMVLDNEELFKLKEIMVNIDETFLRKETDADGKQKVVQYLGYRSVLPFLSAFNKSVYDVIFREHHRLQNEIGASKYTKALLRFDDWFKQNGIVEAHANEIEPFWSSAFDEIELSEPETDPPPLSDDDDWKDVLLELELPSRGRFQLRVVHPNLDIQKGVVVPMDNWQTKIRNILMMQAWMLGYRFDRKELVERFGQRVGVKEINRQNVHKLNIQLKEAVGITNQNPLLRVEGIRGGKNPVLPSIRLSKKLVFKLERIDLNLALDYITGGGDTSGSELAPDVLDSMEYASKYYSIQPKWMNPA